MINPELYLNDFAYQQFILPGTRYSYALFVAGISKFFSIDVDVVLLIIKLFLKFLST